MADYYDSLNKKNILRMRELLKELPPFLRDFFRSLEDYTSTRTRLGYAYDLHIFFGFLLNEGRGYHDIAMEEFDESQLAKVNAGHLEDFMEYLSYYIKNVEQGRGISEREYTNQERGKSRKLSAVRTMFTYYYKRGKIPANPSELIDMPKLHEKVKVYLDVDEIAKLLDQVENGESLTAKQKGYHEKTKTRDLAMLTLLLGTGIRISECIGLNISHVNFENGSFKVIRKGGDEAILYFGNEVEASLLAYMAERDEIAAAKGHEDALFLSLQKKRITDRAVQNLVKKYAGLVTSLKKITPHKLRATFGTTLYRETGDIYLVADILGHKDVNTTRKHYADIDKEQGRRAVKALKLREDKDE